MGKNALIAIRYIECGQSLPYAVEFHFHDDRLQTADISVGLCFVLVLLYTCAYMAEGRKEGRKEGQGRCVCSIVKMQEKNDS